MRIFLRSLVKRKIALTGAGVVGLILVMALFSPFIATHDPMGLDPGVRLQGPSAAHWFGTDHFGRDLFSRIVYGARLTLIGGMGVVVYSVVFGVAVGVLSGY